MSSYGITSPHQQWQVHSRMGIPALDSPLRICASLRAWLYRGAWQTASSSPSCTSNKPEASVVVWRHKPSSVSCWCIYTPWYRLPSCLCHGSNSSCTWAKLRHILSTSEERTSSCLYFQATFYVFQCNYLLKQKTKTTITKKTQLTKPPQLKILFICLLKLH